MSSSDSEFERGFDADLRKVPVPDGLIERLRRAALVDDEGLDAALRYVPVPPGLLDRLRQAVLVDDEGLDAALREVSVPAGLTDRVQHAVLGTDEGLDAAVRNVPVPVGLLGRLQQVPVRAWQRSDNWNRLRKLARWTTAASLMIAIGLCYFAATFAVVMMIYPSADMSRPQLVSSVTVDGSMGPPDREPDVGVLAMTSDVDVPDGQDTGDMRSALPEIQVPELRRRRRLAIENVESLFAPGIRESLLLDTAARQDWGVLTAHTLYDDQPDLEKVGGLIRRGVDLPLVPGSNKPFLLRYGVHPFVQPGMHSKLRTSEVPLAIDAASYELTRRYLAHGQLPPPEAVRTEDFLAAIDYDFPKPARDALALTTALGPSPFGGRPRSLLQVGVQAQEFFAGWHLPTHLILTIDVSASMRWGGRLEMIRPTLMNLVRRLDAEDRISLVVFSEDAEVLLEEGSLRDADELLVAIESLSVRHATNVGAGLRQAYAVARRAARTPDLATRVVLLTDGLAELDRGTTDVIEQRLAEAARQGTTLEVIDLGQEPESDPELALFAKAGGGTVHRATNRDQIRCALLEIVTGRSQLVATDARLKVTFNPKVVATYRLLGHEAEAIAGLLPPQTGADFHAGRWATALYEIERVEGRGKDVATVELSWRVPGGNESHRRTLVRKVRLDQLADSFPRSALSLQEAALVAQAAEALRKSPFARKIRGTSRMAGVLELAKVVDTRLYERPSFVDFISLVKQANRAKPYRSGAKR